MDKKYEKVEEKIMDNRDVKKLYRSRTNKMICGVCGGFGEYLNIDATVVRVIWALLAFGSFGLCLLAYFIAAIIMPDEI